MSQNSRSGRSAKRARKKERRNMRREEWQAYVKQRRRQRRILVLGILSVLVGGAAIAYFGFIAKPKHHVAASPTPAASTSAASCDTKVPPAAKAKKPKYSKAEDQNLDPSKTYIWRLKTSCGVIDIKLDVEHSPKTTNSIAFLARNHFYDGTFFHRITHNTVIQGGDPTGTGSGGAGYQITEAPPKSQKYTTGVVGMAKTGQDPAGSSSSQFFITIGSPGFTPDYAVAGTVTPETLAVANKIEAYAGNDTDGQPPQHKVYIRLSGIIEQ